jgi:hypothetical protein
MCWFRRDAEERVCEVDMGRWMACGEGSHGIDALSSHSGAWTVAGKDFCERTKDQETRENMVGCFDGLGFDHI